MTGHLTGTVNLIENRRVCEEAIQRWVSDPVVTSKRRVDLRKALGTELADLVMEVATLQPKAAKKLQADGTPSRIWWVTRRSLQQATAWQVARLKSKWFDDHLVYDLCCGIGGDAIQLARRGSVVAVDSSSLISQMVSMNLEANAGVPNAQVQLADATQVDLPQDAAVHIDPDRRSEGSRASHPDYYQPAWPEVRKILNSSPCAVVKLAPAATPESTAELTSRIDSHRCWISLAGSVREQSLLCGEAVQHAKLNRDDRSAVAISAAGSATWFTARDDQIASAKPVATSGPLAWIVDPDASVRAAGLTEAFAVEHGLKLIGKPSGFLTCDDDSLLQNVHSLATLARVLWSGSCDDRKLRRELRSRNAYPRVIKVRGTGHDPSDLARRYRKCGEHPVTLWIGRGKDRVYAAISDH